MSETDENKQNQAELTDLEKCQKERDEYLAGWQRARADFLNYKKDETERLVKTIQFANEDLIKDLLYVLDSFSLMELSRHPPADGADGGKDDLKPFLLIRSQLENALRVRGLEKIKVQKGEDFNPEIHEAVETSEDSGSDSHKILEVISDGYYLNGKLIRPSKVRVSK